MNDDAFGKKFFTVSRIKKRIETIYDSKGIIEGEISLELLTTESGKKKFFLDFKDANKVNEEIDKIISDIWGKKNQKH